MIDPSQRREQMLEAIGVGDGAALERLADPADPRFLALPQLRLVLQGSTPDELLPRLNAALAARFRQVPAGELDRDLLRVLKKALGNAHKWGNRREPGKCIAVDAVVAHAGAVIAISDQGEGFDVGRVLGGFERGERVFQHGGSGFLIFQRARSRVSFEAGGRTLLVHFQCLGQAVGGALRSEGEQLARATDAERMRELLARLPRFAGKSLRSCRAEVSGKPREGIAPLVRYAVEYEDGNGALRAVALAGSLLPAGEPARAFSRARQLFALADAPGRVRIPEPLGAFEDPPLVVFDFAPAAALDEHLEGLASAAEVLAVVAGAGERLRALHRSGVALEPGDSGVELAALRRLAAAVQAGLAASPERAERGAAFLAALLARAGELAACPPVPVHGALTWGAILWGEGALYLHGLGEARCAHPGLDLGGFLADLRRFYALKQKGDPGLHGAAREAFSSGYFGDDRPAWRADLPFFEARALALLVERMLRRPRSKWERKIDPLLAQCEAALEA